MNDLSRAIATGADLQISIFLDGVPKFSGRIGSVSLSGWRMVAPYIRAFAHAREVARQLFIDPVVPAGLKTSDLAEIEEIYMRLTPGEYSGIDARAEALFDRETLATAVGDIETSRLLTAPLKLRFESEEGELWGTNFVSGPVDYELTKATIGKTPDELRALMASSKGEKIPVPLVSTAESVLIVSRG